MYNRDLKKIESTAHVVLLKDNPGKDLEFKEFLCGTGWGMVELDNLGNLIEP